MAVIVSRPSAFDSKVSVVLAVPTAPVDEEGLQAGSVVSVVGRGFDGVEIYLRAGYEEEGEEAVRVAHGEPLVPVESQFGIKD